MIDISLCRSLTTEMASIYSAYRGHDQVSLVLEENGKISNIFLNDADFEVVTRLRSVLQKMTLCFPGSAFPFVMSIGPTEINLRLGGVPAGLDELDDTFHGLAVIDEALLAEPLGDAEGYVIGPAGRMNGRGSMASVQGRSPLEAAMKFALTRAEIKNLDGDQLSAFGELGAGMEMRSRHDWARHDVQGLLFEAVDLIRSVHGRRHTDSSPTP